MADKRSSQVSAIVGAALETPSREREAFLREACAGDEVLLSEVERRLSETAPLPGPLEPPSPVTSFPTESLDGDSSTSSTTDGELIGRLIQGRFRILRRLGAGGMGEVYEADDLKLERRVAMKRLPARMRSDQRYRTTLLREARRASALNDPHIAHVYDVVEEAGEAFLLMEFIEGTTLRQKIATPLAADDLLEIAVEAASALATAHRTGIIHCDIKPENIMLTAAGGVKILDFGIARQLARENEESTGTETSGVFGTYPYMAPEVLTGAAPQASADVYALGVTLYEAWTGWRPQASSPPAGGGPPDVGALRPAPPPAVERILKKMLQPDATERYQDAEEAWRDWRAVQASLGRPPGYEAAQESGRSHRSAWAISSLVLLAIVVLLAMANLRPWIYQKLHPVPQEKEVAVLPFAVAGADAATRAFADGMSEVLSAKLTQLTARPEFQVVPVSEVRAKHVATPADARREFGVNLVIEGTWQQEGGTVHVVPVLIDAATHRQLRAKEFVAAANDPIGLETKVASGVLQMLQIELRPQEKQLFANQGTQAPDAYAYYLRGRGYLEQFQKLENLDNAVEMFNLALAQDPHFGMAYAGLGETYWRKYEHSADAQWVERARAECVQATAQGNAGAEGHVCLGMVDNGTGHYLDAAGEFQQALKLEPTSDASYIGLGAAYEGLGRFDDAEKTYQEAIRLRPQKSGCYNWLGLFYYRRARYAEAARLFAQVVKIAPDSYIGYSNLGGVYVDMGDYQNAIPALTHSIAIRPDYRAYSNLGTAYFNEGRFAEAVESYEQALKIDDRHYDVWGNLGDADYWTPGRRPASGAAYRRAIELATQQYQVNPKDAELLSYIAQYHAMLGEKSAAREGIQHALRLDPKSAEIQFNAALVYNQAGDTESSLSLLKKAMAGGISASTVRATPNFENLQSDPRFRALLLAR